MASMEKETSKLTYAVELITPEVAKEYLKKNIVNRPLKSRVHLFAEDMRRGNWQLNGEGICFNTKGELINGQNRLHAIIESGCSIEILVIRNVSEDVTVYDRGTNRSIVDVMALNGLSKSLTKSHFVALARLYASVQNGKNTISDSEIEEFIRKNADDLLLIAEIISKKRKHGGSAGGHINTRSALVMLPIYFALKSGVSKEKLSRFIEVLVTGFYDGNSERAAVVCRNDILNGVIPLKGGSSDRKKAVYQIEKAIFDFVNGYPRQKTYKTVNDPTYSRKNVIKETA